MFVGMFIAETQKSDINDKNNPQRLTKQRNNIFVSSVKLVVLKWQDTNLITNNRAWYEITNFLGLIKYKKEDSALRSIIQSKMVRIVAA